MFRGAFWGKKVVVTCFFIIFLLWANIFNFLSNFLAGLSKLPSSCPENKFEIIFSCEKNTFSSISANEREVFGLPSENLPQEFQNWILSVPRIILRKTYSFFWKFCTFFMVFEDWAEHSLFFLEKYFGWILKTAF